MTTPITNIVDTIYRNIHNQTMNILYSDSAVSCLSSLLVESKKLNFVRTQNIDNNILSIDYNAYFCHDYINLEKQNSDIIANNHLKSVICFSDVPLPTLKKEDFFILNKNLYLSEKITFCPFIYSIWKKYIDLSFMQPGIPQFELNTTENRRTILVVSSNNKEQARVMRENLSSSIKDVGLFVDFSSGAKKFLDVLKNYKVVIVLDDSAAALLALSADCSVISPYKFYDEIITYDDLGSFNVAIHKGLQQYESGETKQVGLDYRKKYDFDKFDKNIYEFILNLTKRPFLL